MHSHQNVRRNSLRLAGHNYKSPGFYAVTICSFNRRRFFAVIDGPLAVPTPIGEAVLDCWKHLSECFPTINTDCFQIMPDHIHAILELTSGQGPSLSTVVSSFKSGASKLIHQNHFLDQRQEVWQRGFHDRIIRNEAELLGLRQYILDNPARQYLKEIEAEAQR